MIVDCSQVCSAADTARSYDCSRDLACYWGAAVANTCTDGLDDGLDDDLDDGPDDCGGHCGVTHSNSYCAYYLPSSCWLGERSTCVGWREQLASMHHGQTLDHTWHYCFLDDEAGLHLGIVDHNTVATVGTVAGGNIHDFDLEEDCD